MGKIMYLADVAEDYYNASCPSYAQNGYEKNVLLDTETEECIFVPGEVTPEEGELIFRCRRSKGITITTLKTPKKEKKEKRNPKFNGIVRKADPQQYGETSFISLPPEIEHMPIHSVKISNLEYFLEVTTDACDRYKGPYEVLHELDRAVVNAKSDFLENAICVSYKRDPYCTGLHVFHFSHFEMIGSVLYAVYEYGGSAC